MTLLLKAGADVDARSLSGLTALLLALQNWGTCSTVSLLIQKGASILSRTHSGEGAVEVTELTKIEREEKLALIEELLQHVETIPEPQKIGTQERTVSRKEGQSLISPLPSPSTLHGLKTAIQNVVSIPSYQIDFLMDMCCPIFVFHVLYFASICHFCVSLTKLYIRKKQHRKGKRQQIEPCLRLEIVPAKLKKKRQDTRCGYKSQNLL